MSIDIEDWYSPARNLDIKKWKYCECRIVEDTYNLLKILKERNIQATCFVLGYFAEKFPELVEKILEDNHEIATHGYSHIPITELTHQQFQDELSRSIKTLEKIVGEKVLGYRAPSFSLTKKTAWAIDIMKKLGLKYDSSIFPTRMSRFGVSDAPIFPYHISALNINKDDPVEEFFEFPLSVLKIPLIRKSIPIAGGFYLRFFPYKIISYGIKKLNKKNQPSIMYIHPWEFDLEQPRLESIKWHHYYRLSTTEKKFKKLLKEFKFTTIRDWIENEI